jgi:hypothetical protein
MKGPTDAREGFLAKMKKTDFKEEWNVVETAKRLSLGQYNEQLNFGYRTCFP